MDWAEYLCPSRAGELSLSALRGVQSQIGMRQFAIELDRLRVQHRKAGMAAKEQRPYGRYAGKSPSPQLHNQELAGLIARMGAVLLEHSPGTGVTIVDRVVNQVARIRQEARRG